ncbi:hypothetical protein CZ787_07270 [Halomonas citrativorans]|uniref:Uncharacterized protein n=1 Tax=Halomonas citrativorans TaxID=2742612 RepID=A0A1R4HWZ2_9GAMM|nr:hypothetical protein CZ787_07270 [Halomonas citrativorans]
MFTHQINSVAREMVLYHDAAGKSPSLTLGLKGSTTWIDD